jgi:hypothetical protein
MAEDHTHRDFMRYDLMAQEALRSVVRQALTRAASPQGIPGDHHFYISFQTRAAGVSVPVELSERYPDEMTIVMQHQFWELVPAETGFSVVLRFGGQPKKLIIPYAAITRFHDPSVPFALQFEPAEVAAPAPAKPAALLTDATGKPPRTSSEAETGAEAEGPKIVSLDQFRKK